MAPWVRHIRATFRGAERRMVLAAYYRECGYRWTSALLPSLALLVQVPLLVAANRLADRHLAGRGAKYTRSHGPLRPVYWENAESRSAALSREYALKQLSADQKRRLAGLPS